MLRDLAALLLSMLLQILDGRLTTAHPFLWATANTEDARETWRRRLGFGKRHHQAMMLGEDGFRAVRHDHGGADG